MGLLSPRDSGFDNPRLFERNPAKGIAKQRHVVAADIGYHRKFGDDIGRVEPSVDLTSITATSPLLKQSIRKPLSPSVRKTKAG